MRPTFWRLQRMRRERGPPNMKIAVTPKPSSGTPSPPSIARRKTGVFRRPIVWSPPVSLARHGGGEASSAFLPHASARGTVGVLPENRKWRRSSLKTLETELEMADPAPRLTQDKDEVLVMEARLGGDQRPEIQPQTSDRLILRQISRPLSPRSLSAATRSTIASTSRSAPANAQIAPSRL